MNKHLCICGVPFDNYLVKRSKQHERTSISQSGQSSSYSGLSPPPPPLFSLSVSLSIHILFRSFPHCVSYFLHRYLCSSVIDSTLPKHMRQPMQPDDVAKKHRELGSMPGDEANLSFYDFIRQWQLYGSTIFEVLVRKYTSCKKKKKTCSQNSVCFPHWRHNHNLHIRKRIWNGVGSQNQMDFTELCAFVWRQQSYTATLPKNLWLAVNEQGIHIMKRRDKEPLVTYDYRNIVNYRWANKQTNKQTAFG